MSEVKSLIAAIKSPKNK